MGPPTSTRSPRTTSPPRASSSSPARSPRRAPPRPRPRPRPAARPLASPRPRRPRPACRLRHSPCWHWLVSWRCYDNRIPSSFISEGGGQEKISRYFCSNL
uniref:Uncharacterized protein n=1 Tax=Arundo donax TaxID=35708 RepID=A0A0A9UXK1_ARUDO